MVVVQTNRRLFLAMSFIAACLAIERGVIAGEPAEDEPRATDSAVERSSGAREAGQPAREPQSGTKALSLGFVLLACIIVGGALLLALVVIWGNRTRRLAQSPLPPVAERDELWFLKPKKVLPEEDSDAQNLARSDPPERE